MFCNLKKALATYSRNPDNPATQGIENSVQNPVAQKKVQKSMIITHCCVLCVPKSKMASMYPKSNVLLGILVSGFWIIFIYIFPVKNYISICECNYHQDLFQLEDVCKSQRALDHIKTTINKINKDKGKLLLNRKKELYGDNLQPKKWASNEIAFVQAMTAQTGTRPFAVALKSA